MSIIHRLPRLLAASVLFVAPAAGLAQEPVKDRSFQAEERVTALDLNLELRNALGTVSRISPDGLEVLEGGEPLTIVSVNSLSDAGSEPWRLVVWVDRPLTPARQLRASVAALARAAEGLTTIGTVEVWLADPSPRLALPATRDPELVDQALSRIALEVEGGDELEAMRRAFLEPAAVDPDDPGPPPTAAERAIALASEEEDRVLASIDGLVTWVAGAERSGPAALLWVHGGFEADLGRFYGADGATPDGSLEEAEKVLGPTLAGYGWVVLPLRLVELLPPKKDRMSTFDRMRLETRDGIDGQSAAVIGIRVPLGGRKGARDGDEAEAGALPLLVAPQRPLERVAEATGGHLVERPDRVDDTIAALGRRVIVTVQGRWRLDGGLRPIEVRAGSLRARTSGWIRSGTPETVAEARARQLVRGELEPGPLFVELGIDPQTPGDEIGVAVRVELEGERGPGLVPERGPVRLTLAQGSATGPVHFVHRVLDDRLEGSAWSQHARVGRTTGAEWLAVVVENLADGLWGVSATALD